jgi:hypothetical protein
MNRIKLTFIKFLLVFLIFILSHNSYSQEKKQQKIDLPEKILTSFKSSYPQATIKKTFKEMRNGEEIFIIESNDNIAKCEYIYSNEGSIIEIKEFLAIKDIPEEIINSLSEGFEGCNIQKTEKVTKGELVEFDMIIKCGKDKYSVNIDLSGNIIKNEMIKHTK